MPPNQNPEQLARDRIDRQLSRPATLRARLQNLPPLNPATLRARLQNLPPLNPAGLPGILVRPRRTCS